MSRARAVTPQRQSGAEQIGVELSSSLARFVRRHVPRAHDADDIVAEVMARIHQHVDALDDRERVTAWVFRIARNAVADHYRRERRRREALGVEVDAIGAGGADGWLHDAEAARAELAACVRPLVDALPPAYRQALELTDLAGRTQAEAARLAGISVSGMKSRVQRGRRLFAARLRDCCQVSTDTRGRPIDFEVRPGGRSACGCDDA